MNTLRHGPAVGISLQELSVAVQPLPELGRGHLDFGEVVAVGHGDPVQRRLHRPPQLQLQLDVARVTLSKFT